MSNELTGAKVLAKMLHDYGVTDIFHVPAVLRTTMAELETISNIRRIHAHGEASAAYMADGYARASGRPGVCAAQIIGALNLAAGLRDAWLAKSPVIALTGGRDQATKFKKAYQEVDDIPAFEPVTKLNATVDSANRFPDMLNQAFRVAVSGSPGPVHLQFKGNEGQKETDDTTLSMKKEKAVKPRTKASAKKTIEGLKTNDNKSIENDDNVKNTKMGKKGWWDR